MILAVTVVLAAGAESKPARGTVSNTAVTIEGTVLDAETLRQLFETDFGNLYAVVEVTLTPKAGSSLDLKLDDFLLRSEATLDHTGPMAAGMIAGGDALVVKRAEAPKKKTGITAGMGPIMGGPMSGPVDVPDNTKIESKTGDDQEELLAALKRKMLPEKKVSETVSGLLFFPMEKENPRKLVLWYTTPAGKVRMPFK
jgi:hypothetical protein